MSRYHPFEPWRWGNRLVVDRSLDLWRDYGTESGLFEIQKAWSRFLFSRDARELALIPKTISEKAEEIFQNHMSDGLPLSGGEMWDQYRNARDVSSREASTWKKAFIDAYSEGIQEHLSEMIPPELDGKLEMFCSTVGAIARHIEAGGDPDDYGVSLGRKVQQIVKSHPQKAELISRAKREAKDEAERHWLWQTSGTYSMQAPWVMPPSEWEISKVEEDLYGKTYFETYFSVLRDHLQDLVPRKVWKNAFLICSLYDEMQFQKDRKKKYGSQKGWTYLRSLRDHDLWVSDERRRDAEKEASERLEKYRNPKAAPAVSMGVGSLLPQFGSSRFHITVGAKAAFEQSGEQPAKYLDRHFAGDFGDVDPSDAALNRESIANGTRVLSEYKLNTGTRIWIITDEGHEVTTLLLPEEY